MAEFPDIPSALKYMVVTCGVEVLKSPAFIILLDVYNLFEGQGYFKNILKIMVEEGFIDSILNCSQDKAETSRIVDRIIHEYGFNYDYVDYLVQAIISSVHFASTLQISEQTQDSNNENTFKESIYASFEEECLIFVSKYMRSNFEAIDKYLQSKGFKHMMRHFKSTVYYGGGTLGGYQDMLITVSLTDIKRIVRQIVISINMPFNLIVDFFKKRCELDKIAEDKYCCRLNQMKIEIEEGYKRNNITFKRTKSIAEPKNSQKIK